MGGKRRTDRRSATSRSDSRSSSSARRSASRTPDVRRDAAGRSQDAMGKLETIAGNITTLSHMMIQNNADVADLKSSVAGSFAR
eukprot:6702620-Pyramimonas_sp.AAC.1